MEGLTMKSLPLALRPYERMTALGVQALSDEELLAVLLKSGSKKRNAMEVAHEILLRSGGLARLGEMSLQALTETEGVGHIKAMTLLCAYELGVRISRGLQVDRVHVQNIPNLAKMYQTEMSLMRQEHFKAVLFDKKWKILKDVTVSVGTLDKTIVHPREVFAEAISVRAAVIVVMHNHPSGEVWPSREDRETTKRLLQAGQIVGIEVADHIIFGGDTYYSFYMEGEMQKLREEIRG